MKSKDLRPNPKNPRKISDAKLATLKRTLIEFGDISGIVFNRNTGNLVGGHQRSKHFNENTEVQITKSYDKPTRTGTVAVGYILHGGERFSYREVQWDKHREMAANIAANKGAGDWDMPQLSEWFTELGSFDVNFDLELTLFDDDELSDLGLTGITVKEHTRVGPTGVDEDDVPEKAPARTKLGNIYQLGNHRLLCGDSTSLKDVKRLMDGEMAVMVFTSPPYSDLRDYGGGLELDPNHLAKFFDIPAKTFYVNLGLILREREIVRYWDAYLDAAKNRGLKLLAWNVWDKGNAAAPAHQQAMFGLCHEWVFVFGEYRELNLTVENTSEQWGTPTTREKDGSLRPRKRHGKTVIRSHRQLDSVIPLEWQKNYASDYTGHPAAFPVSLPESYIEASTGEGEIVVDPFAGSGSTLIACEKLSRGCFAMEIDPVYCDIIVDRWEKYSGQRARLLDRPVLRKKPVKQSAISDDSHA